jgi:hypothetical protein
MSATSRREVLKQARPRYGGRGKAGRSRLLDEICVLCGYERKYASKLLGGRRPIAGGRDSPNEEYLAHVVDGNGAPLHSLLEAGFRPIGPVDVHRGDIDAVIDHMIKGGESVVHMHGFVFDREAIGK